MSYRRRASPLHAAGATAGCAYCLSLAVAALIISAPVVLGALAVTVLGAGVAAGVGRDMRRGLLVGLPLMALIVLVNAVVAQDGLTVILRLGDLPVFGHTDVTLESTVAGMVLALRALVLILCGALYTAAVDPDQVLRLFRRVSFRSALTATLATRLVPVLARDARRLAEAQRCRPGPAPSRVALLRATTAGVLDRALDVAAALEVRGYGAARRPARAPTQHTRHHFTFLTSAAAVLGLAIVARVAGWAGFRAYPTLWAPLGPGQLATAAGLALCGLWPFTQRRGIET